MFAILILSLTLASSMVRAADCPCWPYNGNTSDIICDDTSLTSIPDCVPSDVPILSIRTPSIPLVPETIRRFTNLVRLNVAYFDNPQMTKSFLAGQGSITYFEIYSTSLEYVDIDWFLYTPYMQILILSANRIKSLSSDTFRSMPLLEDVHLNSDELTTLPPTLFEGTSLKSLLIDDNPWQCDCDLATLIQWTRDHGVTVSDSAFCKYPPEFEGVNVKVVTTDLACRK